MTCGLVHASYSLPEWQALKVTLFAAHLCITILYLCLCNACKKQINEIKQKKIVSELSD